MPPDRGDSVKTEPHRKRRDAEDTRQTKIERNTVPHGKQKDASKSSLALEKVKTRDASSVRSKETANGNLAVAKTKVGTSSIGKLNDASPITSNEKRIERLKSQVRLKQSTSVEYQSKGSHQENRTVDKHLKVSLKDKETLSVHERSVKNPTRHTLQHQSPYEKIASKTSTKTESSQPKNLQASNRVVLSSSSNSEKTIVRFSISNRKEEYAKIPNLEQGNSGNQCKDPEESSIIKHGNHQRENKHSPSSRNAKVANLEQNNPGSKSKDPEGISLIKHGNHQRENKHSPSSRNAKVAKLEQNNSGSKSKDPEGSSIIKHRNHQRENKHSPSSSRNAKVAKLEQNNSGSKSRESDRNLSMRKTNQQRENKRSSSGSRDRTRTRTLSPREVKVLHNVESINIQKAKDDVQKFLNQTSVSKSEPDPAVCDSVKSKEDPEEYDYEDDFEDYESDFEEGSSSDVSEDNENRRSTSEDDGSDLEKLQPTQVPPVEEEKKMDSGSYDLAEKKRKNKALQDIKKAIEQENSFLDTKKNDNQGKQSFNLTVYDEGFIDEKVDDYTEKSSMTKSGSINFSDALKRKYERENTAKAKKRGDEIRSMIHFDIVSFTLLDLEPTPYEIYMKSYGKLNTVQCYVQTNEDNLTEETQTEEIEFKNKWTQIPVTYPTSTSSTNVRNEVQIYSQHHLGVGGDSLVDNFDQLEKMITINSVRLNQFLSKAGQTMLILLEESWNYENNVFKKDPKFTLSEGFFPLNMESLNKENSKITKICFPDNNSTTILTVHECLDNVGIISLWSLLEPSAPCHVLSCHSPVSSACFANKANLVGAGLHDGAVCLWDLREELCSQQKKTRSPSYHTAEILKDKGHLTKVVGIEQLTQSDTLETDFKTELAHVQLCSVDEEGLIIIWTVVYSSVAGEMSCVSQQDLGLAPWSRVRLVPSMMTKLSESLKFLELPATIYCVYLAVDCSDHIYIGTNTGHILHCLKSGNKAYPRIFNCSKGKHSCITWIETCPFGAPFFMVGLSDGTVQLYSRFSDTCIWSAIKSESCIMSIQWAAHSPCYFFTLHNDSRLNVWQIHENCISCIETVTLESSITAFQFSPREKYGKQIAYLAIAVISNSVEIHQLQSGYCCHSETEFENEITKFEHFVSTF